MCARSYARTAGATSFCLLPWAPLYIPSTVAFGHSSPHLGEDSPRSAISDPVLPALPRRFSAERRTDESVWCVSPRSGRVGCVCVCVCFPEEREGAREAVTCSNSFTPGAVSPRARRQRPGPRRRAEGETGRWGDTVHSHFRRPRAPET